jgi:hypothetical protein
MEHQEYPKWLYKNGNGVEGVIVESAEAAEALGWEYCDLGATPVKPKPPTAAEKAAAEKAAAEKA